MPNRMIPLSVRISESDAAFLASMKYDGANSLSEKTRALIAEARRRRENEGHLDEAVRVLEDIHEAQDSARRAAEREGDMHSELLGQFSRWLMETHIRFLEGAGTAGLPDRGGREGGKPGKGSRPRSESPARQEAMRLYEKRMADQIFLLMDLILRQGLTEKSHNYDPGIVRDRMEGILELCALIRDP